MNVVRCTEEEGSGLFPNPFRLELEILYEFPLNPDSFFFFLTVVLNAFHVKEPEKLYLMGRRPPSENM